MSQSSDPGYDNPFASPQSLGAQALPPPRSQTDAFPTFSKAMFIIDLVCCCLRLPLVLLAIPGYFVLQKTGGPLLPTVMFEIGSGVAIVLTGIPGNILLLTRKSWASVLGWLCLLATVTSLGVGLWQASIMFGQFVDGSPERIGGYIGAGLTLVTRLSLLILYAVALVNFSQWAQKQQANVTFA